MLGEYVPCSVLCLNASNVPKDPTAAPTMSIYDNGGTEVIADSKVPPKDVGQTTGLFELSQLLDSNFAVGTFVAKFNYAISGTTFSRLGSFTILAGGHAKGPYTSMHWYHPPHAKFIVGETADGTTEDRRNPHV